MVHDCILYNGHIGNAGYGLDYDPETKKTITAHRLAFKAHYGYLPKVVMHLCDNKACVNPDHLLAGTQSENIQDCVRKGRHGAKSKLSSTEILEILLSDSSSRQLAKKYNVNQKTICNVRNHKYNYDITGHGGSCGV